MGNTKWVGITIGVTAIIAFFVVASGFPDISRGLPTSSKPHELVAVSHDCLVRFFPDYNPIDSSKQDFDKRSPQINTMEVFCPHATSNKLPETIMLNVPEELRTPSGTEKMKLKLVDLYEYSDGQIEIAVKDDATGKRYTTTKYHD
jgi:hypothetical protein